MSYELVFWKRKPGMAKDSTAVYRALMAGRPVDGLVPFPVEEFLERVTRAFHGSRREMNGPEEWVVWRGDDERGMFEVTWSANHVRIDVRGLSSEDGNRLVDIGAAVGAPLYDPQTSERFDSWTDA